MWMSLGICSVALPCLFGFFFPRRVTKCQFSSYNKIDILVSGSASVLSWKDFQMRESFLYFWQGSASPSRKGCFHPVYT